MNPYSGEYPVKIQDKDYVLVFDWNAIAKIETSYGRAALPSLFTEFKPDVLAGILEAGFSRHHPELTASKIIELSPPYLPCVQAVDKAMAYAYFGTDTLESEKKSLIQKILSKIT